MNIKNQNLHHIYKGEVWTFEDQTQLNPVQKKHKENIYDKRTQEQITRQLMLKQHSDNSERTLYSLVVCSLLKYILHLSLTKHFL